MITAATREFVIERAGGYCENPECHLPMNSRFEIHHIYWRSQYRSSDRDEPWNLSNLCAKCHYSIHSQGNVILDKYLKASADREKQKHQRSNTISKDILDQRKRRRADYRKKLEAYKSSHGGNSPYQVRYAYLKEKYGRSNKS